ncbi:MAG: CheB methylesterase domain-containing protein, partial [Planctomycetota bacterium]
PPAAARARAQRIELLILAASAGGPATLAAVFASLRAGLDAAGPADLEAALIIVQHMPPVFTTPMAQRFAELVGRPVRVAEQGDAIEPGTMLVAPGGRNLFVNARRRIELSAPAEQPGEYPKIDLALVTAAEVYGPRLCAAIMTGMGRDGTEGLCHARKLKGLTCIQEPSTCVVDGMPSAAWKAGAAEIRLTPDEIGQWAAQILVHARAPSLEGQPKGRGRSGN